MAELAFEPNVAPYVDGSIEVPQILDPGLNPASIIRTTDNWKLKLRWSINGLFVPLGNPAAQWHIKAYLEGMGTVPDVNLPEDTEPFGPPANAHTYTKTLNFGAVTRAGAYRLVVVITLTNGAVAMPVAAFSEGPMVTFYDA